MSKPKHPMPNKTSKKISKEVRSGLLAGDTPAPAQVQANQAKAKVQIKTAAKTKKKTHRNERRVSTRTPHADDGTWGKKTESKLLDKALVFGKKMIKSSVNKMNRFFKGKSSKR